MRCLLKACYPDTQGVACFFSPVLLISINYQLVQGIEKIKDEDKSASSLYISNQNLLSFEMWETYV